MIPVIINNFNRLSTTRQLVEDLHRLGYLNIHILDNNSTYPPLLEWYNRQGKAKVIMLYRNYGPRALWDSGYINAIKQEWHVYTDSDLELNPRTQQQHFIERLKDFAFINQSSKVGLALRIDDIQPHQYGRHYVEWEKQFWADPIPYNSNLYRAQIDTTFAIQKTYEPFTYEAIRVAGDFTARHIPWYTDFNQLSREEQYFLDHANEQSTYTKHYRQFLKQS